MVVSERAVGFAPTRICEVEIGEPLAHLGRLDGATGREFGAAHILVRLDTEPIGVVQTTIGPDGLPVDRLAEVIWRALSPAIVARAPSVRLTGLPSTGLPAGRISSYLDGRAEVLSAAPPISVVLCTRDPDEQILPCLAALDRQQYPDYEIVVVDNAPLTDALTGLLARGVSKAPVRRVVEPRPGVAWARNRGWRAASAPVVAYIDDDEVADPHWLAELARGFRARPSIAGVTGIILPAVLDTPAQHWFEQFGGHSKGRGFTRVVFDRASHAVQHPLYPLPPFGSTGNMAVRRAVLAQLGGFDVALGAGTPALGSEDTAFLCDLMLAGHTLVYQPSALVRHHHYESWSGISNQLYGYGLGLSAFYTRTVLRNPSRLFALARLAPTAVRELAGRRRAAGPRGDYPAELDRLERQGMWHGPAGYLRSRRLARRVSTRSWPLLPS